MNLALLRPLMSLWAACLLLLLLVRGLALLSNPTFAPYAYILNSPNDFSARDVQLHDPQTGVRLNLLHRPTRFGELTLAPDARRFAFVENLLGIFTSDILGSPPSRLVAGYVGNPLWSPDGEKLLYSDGVSINLLSLQSLEEQVLMPLRVGTSWLPNSQAIAYSEFNPDSRLYEIRIRHLSDERVTSLFASPDLIVYLAFSPDERWLAYSALTGQIHIHEIATGHEIVIQDEANHFAPQWSADSQYLLFIRTLPRQNSINIAIANQTGEIIYTHTPRGLTLESSVLWWPR